MGNSLGENVPEITSDFIGFNGLEHCGHLQNSSVSIPWPSPTAAGIGSNVSAIDGEWFAGSTLQHRTCNGDCSYESVVFEKELQPESWQNPENGLYFNFCKTAFRPYDLAVTAFLLIAKHHMQDDILISTDGEQPQWDDARRLCYVHLGYGPEFVVVDREIVNRMVGTPESRKESERERQRKQAAESAQAFTETKETMRTDPRYANLCKIGEKACGGKLVAINLRIELKAAFPGVKFSIRSDYNSVRIAWTDGPRTAEVEAITSKYSAGSFDGMTDSYNYQRSPFTEVYGSAQYIFENRSHSVLALTAAAEIVAARYGYQPFNIRQSYDGSGYIDCCDHNHQSEVYAYLEKRYPFDRDDVTA
jgi:hypothetical protein